MPTHWPPCSLQAPQTLSRLQMLCSFDADSDQNVEFGRSSSEPQLSQPVVLTQSSMDLTFGGDKAEDDGEAEAEQGGSDGPRDLTPGGEEAELEEEDEEELDEGIDFTEASITFRPDPAPEGPTSLREKHLKEANALIAAIEAYKERVLGRAESDLQEHRSEFMNLLSTAVQDDTVLELSEPMFAAKRARTSGSTMTKELRQLELRESIGAGLMRLQAGGNLPVFNGVAQAANEAVQGRKLSALMERRTPKELDGITTACTMGNSMPTRFNGISSIIYSEHHATVAEVETQIRACKNLLAAGAEICAVNEFGDVSGAISWVGVTTKISKLLLMGGAGAAGGAAAAAAAMDADDE